jgi:hypothetical protein
LKHKHIAQNNILTERIPKCWCYWCTVDLDEERAVSFLVKPEPFTLYCYNLYLFNKFWLLKSRAWAGPCRRKLYIKILKLSGSAIAQHFSKRMVMGRSQKNMVL